MPVASSMASPMAEGLTSISVPSGPGAPPFAFEDLFAPADNGLIQDPSVVSSLFKDAAGAVPVTADGDLVYRIDDVSGNGNHSLQPNVAKRYVYRTSGGLHWLEGDGVDDYSSAPFISAGDGFSAFLCSSSENSVPLAAEYGMVMAVPASDSISAVYSVQDATGSGAFAVFPDTLTTFGGINSLYAAGGEISDPKTIAVIIEDGAQALRVSDTAWAYGSSSLFTDPSTAFTTASVSLPSKFFGALVIDRAVSITEAGDTIALFQSKAT